MDLLKESILDSEVKALRVLVVDDDPSSLQTLEFILSVSGCKVELADGFQIAMDKINSMWFDLLVVDWNMPVKNGGETLMAIDHLLARREESIPFVLCTGVDPQTIDLPHTKCLKFVDFWEKSENLVRQKKRFNSVLNRIPPRGSK